MIKQKLTLEQIIGEKVFHMVLDNDSPTSSIKEALGKFMSLILGIEEEAKKKAEAAQPPAAPVAPVEAPAEQPKAPDGNVI